MEKNLTKLLHKLVSINSIYPFENNLALFIEKLFINKGFVVKKQYVEKNRFNLLIEKGHGKKSIMFYSHLDTINITPGWKTNPFCLVIKKGKAYGLGSYDMKSGMATNILTFLNYTPKNFKIKLAFCVDEENISKGGHTLIKSNFMKDVACVISPEPAFFYGQTGIVIGRIGRAVYEVNILGKNRHFAMYKNEFDLNLFVAEFIQTIKKINKISTHDKKQFLFVRNITSESLGMSIPHRTRLEIDSSITPPNTSQDILKILLKNPKKINLKYNNNFIIKINFIKRQTPFLEGYEINKEDYYLKILSKSVYKVLRQKAHPYFRSSVADENIFGSHGITTLGIGTIGDNAHSPDEWVLLSSMEKLYNIFINFLDRVDKKL